MSSGHWVGYIGNFQVNYDTLITMWSAMAFIIICSFLLTRNLQIIPSKGQAIVEKIMDFLLDALKEIKNGEKHIPLIGSLFLFILFANLMGQLPLKLFHLEEGEFASPTNDLNMTAAMAIVMLVYYLYQAFKTKGIHSVYHGFSVTGIIETFIDFLDMITRPLSLSLRLFANIYAGEILVATLIALFPVILPVPIMLFEIFVAFIQAYVFMMLSIAYINMSVSEEH